MKEYKAEFYCFMEHQHTDNLIKIHTFLETRKNGYLLENTSTQTFYNIETANLRLKIISTYYKKSLLPTQYERNFLLHFLYSNNKIILDNEILRDLRLFLSQFFFHAHTNLKKNPENFGLYSEFIFEIYKFCYGNLGTDLFEVGVQVLLILLNISKGR